MKVHETNNVVRQPHADPKVQKVQQETKHGDATGSREAESPDAASQRTSEKTRGVIRLLEEGHFKGVADVRLRINFLDELSSRANLAAQQVVDDQTTKLSDAVATKIEESLTGLGVDDATKVAIEDAVAAFDTAIQEGVATFSTQDSAGADALVASFETQIETLMATLTDLLQPKENETPESTDPITPSEATTPDSTTPENLPGATPEDLAPGAPFPESQLDASVQVNVASLLETGEIPDVPGNTGTVTDPDGGDTAPVETSDPVDVYTEALVAIRESAESALAELKEALTGVLDLGEPSEPTGNGGAYDRFLALYRELLGGRLAVDEQV